MHLHFCESLLSARVQLDLCFARTKVDFKLHKVASHKPLCQTHHFALLWDPSTCVPIVLKWPTGVCLCVTQQHLPCCLRPLDVCYCNLRNVFLPISTRRHRWGSLLGGFQEVGSRHQAGWSCPGKQTSFLLVTISFHQQSRSSHNFHINLCFVLCL